MITGSEEESRALMMNAAIRIVAQYGFEGFTTKKWAAEAGVYITTLKASRICSTRPFS